MFKQSKYHLRAIFKIKTSYSWRVMFLFFIISFMFMGVRMSFGVFFKSLETEFELSRLATSSIISMFMVLSAIFAVIDGWILDRYGPRHTIFFMALLAGLSLLITSFTSSWWQLYFSYSLLLAVGTGGTMAVTLATVSKWFDKNRGLALGIASSGSNLGTILMAPFAAYLISNLTWRYSYLIMGFITLAIIIPLTALLLKKNLGEKVESNEVQTESTNTVNRASKQNMAGNYPVKKAFQSKNFWYIIITFFLMSFCIYLIFTHIVPFAMDMGISAIEAATILSIIGIGCLVARLVIGKATDNFGIKIPAIISTSCIAFTMFGLLWVKELCTFYLFAAFFGFFWGGMSICLFALGTKLFEGRNLGIIMGIFDSGFSLGGAIGPAAAGYLFDVSNNYEIAFITSAMTMVIAIILMILVTQPPRTE